MNFKEIDFSLLKEQSSLFFSTTYKGDKPFMDVKLTPLMLKLLFAALLCSSTAGFGDDLKFSL